MNIKPVLKENNWSNIIEVANKCEAQNYWKICDEIDIQLSGYFDETVTLQIWDFNHFDKSDGNGKANILFGMKHLMKNKQCMDTFYFNDGGWNDSYMRTTVMKNIYESIPKYIRSHIKEVNTYANAGNGSKSESIGLLSTDKVFIPGLSEIYNNQEDQNKTETGQKKFPIFGNNSSRIKRLNNGSGPAEYWWSRSHYCYSCTGFCGFGYDGRSYNYAASRSSGVCVCFNI